MKISVLKEIPFSTSFITAVRWKIIYQNVIDSRRNIKKFNLLVLFTVYISKNILSNAKLSSVHKMICKHCPYDISGKKTTTISRLVK